MPSAYPHLHHPTVPTVPYQASIALATSLAHHPLTPVAQSSSIHRAVAMPYDRKKGKLAHLPPSPAYQTVLAMRALRATSTSSMDISRPAQLATGAERRTTAKSQSRLPTAGDLSAAPTGQVMVPQSKPQFLPPPSHTEALQDHKPPAISRKPITHNVVWSTNQAACLASQQLRATAPRHQLPREVLEISYSSTVESSDSSSFSSSSLSIPPSGPSWDEPMTQAPPPPQRCFFDEALEDHIRAHERYIRKGGRVNPRSLYATLPTNVADLAAHLGLATSHVKSDASAEPSRKRFGGDDRLPGRASSSSKVKETSTYVPETVDRFAHHGSSRAFTSAKATPLGTSRKSNGQPVDELLPPQMMPQVGTSTRSYATPKKQRPRQADRHQLACVPPIRSPSTASYPHPMRLRPRQADLHSRPSPRHDLGGSTPGACGTVCNAPTPDRASPSPHGRLTNQAGGQAARRRAHQFFPSPGPATRNKPAHPDPRCGLVISDFFHDPPCPDVLRDDSHEVMRQIQDFLNSQMQRA